MLLHYARRKPADEPAAPEPSAPIAAGSPASKGQASASVGEAQFTCQSIVKFLPSSSATRQAGDASHLRFSLPTPGSIRGLVLDADLVVSNTAAWCQSLAQLLAHVGCESAGAVQHRLWRNQQLADVFRGRRELGDLLERFLESLSIARGRRDEVLTTSLSQWREAQSSLHLLPGVRKTLRRIAACGAKLAIVADSTACGHELQSQLAEAGLAEICTTVVTSVDVDRVLPDPEMYRLAVDRLGEDPSATLCVAQECVLPANGNRSAIQCVFTESPARSAGCSISRLADLVELFEPRVAWAKAG